MGRKSNPIELSAEERHHLEQGYKTDDKHSFRQLCKMILLKADGYTSKEVAGVLSTNEISVHNWLKRYESESIEGLRTRAGKGRKPILKEEHLALVRTAVEEERQRLRQAQQIVEENIGKKMSGKTLRRFLKVITAVTNESENDRKEVVTKLITTAK